MIKTMVSEKIQELDAKALSELLKEVKLYRDLTKNLWARGRAQYFRDLKGEKLLVVEYVSSITEDIAWEQAQSVYKESFSLDVQKENVTFIINDALKGWIKVYNEDSLVDLSFAKIEGLVK